MGSAALFFKEVTRSMLLNESVTLTFEKHLPPECKISSFCSKSREKKCCESVSRLMFDGIVSLVGN